MRKSILLSAYTLEMGGIEKSLVAIVNELCKKYDVSLILEKERGELLGEVDKRVMIMEYNPSNNSNIIIRKIINFLKRISFIMKYKNKFELAISFATYSKMGSFCARMASKNNVLWGHTDYLAFYNQDTKKMIKYFKFIKYNKFKKIIMVSNKAKENFEKVFPKEKSKLMVINNPIDYKDIIDKSKVSIKMKKTDDITTFLNVARQEDESKRITRLIVAAEYLRRDNENFKILLIGAGKDTNKYKEMVKEKKLEKNIFFLGYQNNPYPYFKISDCFILTSEYEGYPVVFNEAKALNLPIITTDVSDSKEDINGKYGVITNKSEKDVYLAMKDFIHHGYKIKKRFDGMDFNKKIFNKIEELVNI